MKEDMVNVMLKTAVGDEKLKEDFCSKTSKEETTVETKENITMERSEFESQLGRVFSLIHVVQTRSGAHTTSFPMDTAGCFPGSKAVEA
jgi:hypothetical protein